MKISRINHINNHRIFRDFKWPKELPDFSRFNLIYGWNGTGKTTLSNILTHLQKKLPIQEGEIEFQFGTIKVPGTALSSAQVPSVKVFNRDSINANIFESTEQQFSPIYYLGEETVETQRQIEAEKILLAEALKTLSSEGTKKQIAEMNLDRLCIDQAKLIKEALNSSGPNPYNNYDKSDFSTTAKQLSPKYSQYILSPSLKIKLREKKDGKPKDKIARIQEYYPNIKELTDKAAQVLSRSLVSQTIEKLESNSSIAQWVQQGLEIHKTDEHPVICEFCNQEIPGERIRQLELHFNDEFNKFMLDLTQLIKTVEDAKQQLHLLQTPEPTLFYEHLISDLRTELGTLVQFRFFVGSYLDAIIKALMVKRENPFMNVDLSKYVGYENNAEEPKGFWGSIFTILVDGFSQLGAIKGQYALSRINTIIDDHNLLTENFQNEIEKARETLEECLIAEKIPEYLDKSKNIVNAEEKRKSFESTVKQHRDTIQKLELRTVEHMQPAEELNAEIRSYLGRDELTFSIHDKGYAITRHGSPAGNLSEGEKTAIAFLYFLKSLRDKSFDKSNSVIVIDDPVSSLDANSLYSAFGYMKDRTKDSGQLFVLTHSFSFFRQVKNWFNQINKVHKNSARFFMLESSYFGVNRTAAIAPLDSILHKYESEYHYLFKMVYDEAAKEGKPETLDECYLMPNVARRLLEGFLAFKYPNNAGKIYQQLELIEFDGAKKSKLIRFLDTYSHYEHIAESDHDLSILSETRSVLSDLLSLIREVDDKHYAGMIKAIC